MLDWIQKLEMTTLFTKETRMTKFTRDELIELLHSGIVEVTFIKVNGDKRVMPCTLNLVLLPEVVTKPLAEGEVVKKRTENLDTLRVFCTDKNEWRSFRIDSVLGSVKV